MISVVCPFLAGPKCLNIDTNGCVSGEDIKYAVSKRTAIPAELFTVFSGCHKIQSEEMVPDGSTVYLAFALPGGKGGFGSMLRAIGAQIEKTTNREACRDLTGRRLRDINEEQRLKKWLEKKAEREIEAAKRRKERLERLKQQPKHDFHDVEYNRQRSELPERIDDALTEGLQKATPVISKKRVAADDDDDESEKILKKHCLLMGIDLPSESGSSDEESTSSERARSSDDTSQSAEYNNHQDAESEASCSMSAHEGHQETIREGSTECESKEPELNSECLESSPDHIETASMDKSTEEGADSNFNRGEFSGESNILPSVVENSSESHDIPLKEEQHTHHNEAPANDTEKSADGELKIAGDSSKNDQSPLVTEESSIDLLSFTSVSELENLGLDRLKGILMSLGLKCGGTLTERAQRLWSVRGLDPSDFPQALKAKTKKK